jgi:hypothetical protein
MMTEFSGLREPNIFEGFLEIPQEIGELLEANNGAWREDLQKIRNAKRRSSAQKISVIQFVSEMLEIALPDSYLEHCPPHPDGFDESSLLSSDTAVADTLNTEERLLLIDKLWVPEWSAPLPKSARRLIGLILAAIDGRPYATPFVEIWGSDRPLVLPINLERAFGISENEASTALSKAISGLLEVALHEDFVPPFDFNT